MQQKHIWREDMRLEHAKLEMPVDYLSRNVHRAVSAANQYLEVIIGN